MSAPTPRPPPTITAISAGDSHTCALTSAGGVMCWGWNGSGQLGNGTQTSTSVPVDVSGLPGEVAAISAGGHTCALSRGGGVTCWGHNADGRLGNGTLLDSSFPVDVSGLASGVAAVEVGSTHTCGLMTEGRVVCWGRNDFGQLGNGTTTASLAPVDVVGLASGVRAISAGGGQTCALTAQGGVKCWGSNYAGQLGNGTTTDSRVPVQVSGLTSGVVAITTGTDHSCALTGGGGVTCWGAIAVEQTADGGLSSTFALIPLQVPGLSVGVASISAGTGGFHTCAVSRDGGALCWGDNRHGQLGNGTTNLSYTPVTVNGLTSGVAAISGGYGHTCALMRRGGVTCWGWNDAGVLGDGSTIDSTVPVDVVYESGSLTLLDTLGEASPSTPFSAYGASGVSILGSQFVGPQFVLAQRTVVTEIGGFMNLTTGALPIVVQIRPSVNGVPDSAIVLATYALSNDNDATLISHESVAPNLTLGPGTYFALFAPQDGGEGNLLTGASRPFDYRAGSTTLGFLDPTGGTSSASEQFGAVRILGRG